MRLCRALFVALTLAAATAAAEPVVTPPVMTRFVEARLPADAPARDAVVELWLVIDAAGAVTEVEVKEPAGSPWDEAAAEAALSLEFSPALVDGVPAPVKVPFRYAFIQPRQRGRFGVARAERRDSEAVPGARVRGEVQERGTRAPLYGVLVRATDGVTTWEALTRDDGAFTLEGLPAGTVQLEVAQGGYLPLRTALDVPGVATGPLQIDPLRLDPDGSEQYRTVIQGERKKAAATEVLLEETELTRTPGTFGDPTRVVASLPGVARTPFGLGYYVVRGANLENTGFFIDGHPALYLYHLVGGPAVIHPEAVGRLRFYPGGYPPEFGRFAGGVIALDIKDPPEDRWHLDVELDVLKASVLFTLPFDEGRGLLTASLRRSYYELVLPLVVDDVELSYTDYMLRATWQATPSVRLLAMVLGAEDRFAAAAGDSQDGSESAQDLGLGFHRLQLGAVVDLDRTTSFSTSVAFEVDHTAGQRVAEDDEDLKVSLVAYGLNAKAWFDWEATDVVAMQTGVDLLWTHVESDLTVPSFPPLGDPRPPQFDPITLSFGFTGPMLSVAPWIGANLEVAPGVNLLPGVRFNVERYAGATHLSVDPKVAVRWRFHPDWTLKAAVALAHQSPPVFQVEEPYGDPNIPQVSSLQTSLGAEWEFFEGWDLSVEGFYNHYGDIARANQTYRVEEGDVRRASFVADVEGRAFGLEVMLRRQLGSWAYGWLSYTLSRSERLIPPNDWKATGIDQAHVLNLAWSFLLGDGWSLGARFTLTTGNPAYPVTGARYDADRDRYQPLFGDTEERLPVFHRLDLRVDKTWRFDTWLLGAYIDVQNVYNQMNPESRRYSYDYTIKTDGIGLPILPTLGVKATF